VNQDKASIALANTDELALLAPAGLLAPPASTYIHATASMQQHPSTFV
jgi:hypothetical protein